MSKAKQSKEGDQSNKVPMEPTIKADSVAPVKTAVPVQVETTTCPEESPCNSAAETHARAVEEEVVVSQIEKAVCANPVLIKNEQVSPQDVKANSPSVVQEDLNLCAKAVAETLQNPCTVENHPREDDNKAPQDNPNSSGGDAEVLCKALKGLNLSSSKKRVRWCDEEFIPAVVKGDAGKEVSERPQNDGKNEPVGQLSKPVKYFGQGLLGNPEYHIVETEPQYDNGAWLPRVIIPSDIAISDEDAANTHRQSYKVPSTLSGIIIGKRGKNVAELKEKFQAEISISPYPQDYTNVLLTIVCPESSKDQVIGWLLKRIRCRPSMTPIGNPGQLVRTPELGKLQRVFIRSSFSRKHLFVNLVDKKYTAFLEMEKQLTDAYSDRNSSRCWLYGPVTVGTIAVLKTGAIYSRVVVLDIVDNHNSKLAICFLLDHARFTVASINDLRKIKTRFMQIDFQAVSLVWAHAQSAFIDASDESFLARYFNSSQIYIYPVRNETCCRADVVFLKRIDQPNSSSPTYQDILLEAVNDGQCTLAGKVINVDEQVELNRSDVPFYFCPLVDFYKGLVFYRFANGDIMSALDCPHPKPTPPKETQEEQQQDQLVNMHRRQQRQGNNGGNRAVRINNSHRNGGGRGGFRGPRRQPRPNNQQSMQQ